MHPKEGAFYWFDSIVRRKERSIFICWDASKKEGGGACTTLEKLFKKKGENGQGNLLKFDEGGKRKERVRPISLKFEGKEGGKGKRVADGGGGGCRCTNDIPERRGVSVKREEKLDLFNEGRGGPVSGR